MSPADWLRRRWSRLASGPKMLLVMSAALLPLGIIAILASLYSARENSEHRAAQTLLRLEDKAQILDGLLTRSAAILRAAHVALATTPPDEATCARMLARIADLQPIAGRYALFFAGQRRCSTPGFTPMPTRVPDADQSVGISRDGRTLSLVLFSGSAAEAVAEFGQHELRELTFIPGTRADFTLELLGPGRRMLIRDDYRPVPFVQEVTHTAAISASRLNLRIRLNSVPIRPMDVLLIFLPVMMWMLAAVIAWWTVNRELLRPLARFQKAVSAYRPGDPPPDLSWIETPAREINELGAAFHDMTGTVAHHEAELEAAVDRQTRLVREVHHRVKNNLQIVASLLNLHSRGSPSADAAAAYASIQRRVDALAVVHRNHYAELEENVGVALKPLISELAANLRATAPPSVSGMQIQVDIAPVHVTQDVAVSVAFMITEIAEYGMLCGASQVSILLEPEGANQARLGIEVDSLAGIESRDQSLADRFERIINGLARQLRSALERDPQRGRYTIIVATMDRSQGISGFKRSPAGSG